MTKYKTALIYLGVASIIWGITIPILKMTLEQIPIFTLAFLRFTLASIFSLPIFLFNRKKRLDKKDLPALLIVALLGTTLSISFFFTGLKFSSAIDSSLIISLGPIATSIIAFVYLKEKISRIHLFGIALSFLGVLFIIFEPTLPTKIQQQSSLLGNFLIFGAVIAGSFFVILSKKLFSHYKPTTIITFSFFIGAISFLPTAIIEYISDPNWLINVNMSGIFGVVFVGIFSSWLAYLIHEWSLEILPIHIISISSYLIPIVAIVSSIYLLGEKISQGFIFAAALILIGTFFGTYSKHEHHRRPGHRV